MPCQVKVGGVWKTLTDIQVKVGGVWKSLTKGQVKVGGVWKTFFEVVAGGGGGGGGGSLTVTVDDSTISGSAHGFSYSGSVTSAVATVSVTAGSTGGISYAWTRISVVEPFSGGFTCLYPSRRDTAFRATVADFASSETWRCTATDSIGVIGYVDVVVSLHWIDLR